MYSFSNFELFYVLGTYLLCAIPFGVIVSRLVGGRDVREHGSGNTGATNVARVMGKKWGILVLALDALKGAFAILLARKLLRDPPFDFSDFLSLLSVIAVFAHCYPAYLSFKGGKGVATALGVIAAMDPRILGLATAVFFVVVFLSRRISAGSLAASLSLPLFCFFYPSPLRVWAALTIAGIIWWKHRENLRRLLNSQEPKFF